MALVEAQDGAAVDVAERWIRNLDINTVERGTLTLRNASACTNDFSEERWGAFSRDVRWFKATFSDWHWDWDAVYRDHGYNATPVWTMTGTILANQGAASHGFIRVLSLLDPLLLVAMWAVVGRAFGWPAAAVAAIWWGTNYLARFDWTGGAFLRMDWLFFMVLSVCLAYRKRMFWSGGALAFATLLRVFPVFLAGGLVLQEAVCLWHKRTLRPSRDFVHFVGGAVVAAALLMPLSALVNSGQFVDIRSWQRFAANTQKLQATPMTNRVGLKTVASFDPATTVDEVGGLWIDGPWDAWYAARERTFTHREPWFWAVVAAFVALLARAAAGHEPWVGLVLGSGLVAIVLEPTSYYYSFFLLYGLLALKWPWAGAALCLTSLLTWAPPALLSSDDKYFTAISVIVVLFVFGVTSMAAFDSSQPRREASRPA